MPRAKPNGKAAVTVISPTKLAQRTAKGTWKPGFSGSAGLDVARARKQLNGATIEAMHEAFRRGGRQAIDKVMRNAPAQFLKMLVLLVPRELEVTHSSGVKGMSDEQISQAIEAIEQMLARRTGEQAKVIEASPVLPGPEPQADPT